jgi:cytochrome c551/c552
MPPAYHTVVDPNMPIPNLRSPYEEDDDTEKEEEEDIDTPEIIINASTQIRGHGNIVSIAQMDSARIAGLITSLLNREDKNGDEKTPDTATPSSSSSPPQTATQERTSRTQVRGTTKKYPNTINITVNCGATIIGDRNIVGPGLGDVARQMQMAQRNQAAAAAQGKGQGMPSPPPSAMPANSTPQYHGVATPPMSRSGSLQSEGVKRKAPHEDGVGGEGGAKRQC